MQAVIDVDTGVDDALALLFAARHPGLTVRAVTCVAGNAGLPAVVRNTLDVLDIAGAATIPVAAGAQRPLLVAPSPAAVVHGSNGVAGVSLADLGADTSRQAVPQHAVELLREAILESPEPVTVIALAPLTNIALLLRTYPETAGNIECIAFMGGATSGGNATALAEFNVWHDPHAAHICTTAGIPVLMYGLDVFYQPRPTAADAAAMAASGDGAARLAATLLQHREATTRSGPVTAAAEGEHTGDLGDAGLVCALLHPELLHTAQLPMTVSLAEGVARGHTVVDQRPAGSNGQPPAHQLAAAPVDVALGIDGDAVATRYTDLLLGRGDG